MNAMDVVNDRERHRFRVRLPEGEGELIYAAIAPRTLELVHTEVASSLRGRGVGDALVETALAYAREHGLKIVATCPYVQRWLTKHPEQNDIVIPRAEAQ
jgi:predicted GNAT family acetyltransferase